MSQHAPDPLGDPAGFDSHEEVELDLEPDPTPGLTEDTVGMYLREISQVALLTAAEEVSLAKALERGDLRARRRLIESNLRLVVSIARRYSGRGLSVPRPDPGGQRRPDEGRRALRLAARAPVLDVRDMVDPPGRDARARRPGPHHPGAGAGRRHDQPHGPRRAAADSEAQPAADARGARRGDGHQGRRRSKSSSASRRSRCRWRRPWARTRPSSAR